MKTSRGKTRQTVIYRHRTFLGCHELPWTALRNAAGLCFSSEPIQNFPNISVNTYMLILNFVRHICLPIVQADIDGIFPLMRHTPEAVLHNAGRIESHCRLQKLFQIFFTRYFLINISQIFFKASHDCISRNVTV